MSKLLKIPGPITLALIAIALVMWIGVFFATQSADELETYGASAKGVVTEKLQTQETNSDNADKPVPSHVIRFTFALNNGQTITSSARLPVHDWRQLETGKPIIVRYALRDPQKHKVYLEEYTGNIETFSIFGWLFSFFAGLALLFDIRRHLPFASGIAGTAAYFMLCVGILSIVIGGAMRWSLTQTGDGVEITTGNITGKSPEKHNDAAADTNKQFTLTYIYTIRGGGPVQASRNVGKEFFDDHSKGGNVLIAYAFHDPDNHQLRSGANLDAADGFTMLGVLMALLGGILYAIRYWRVAMARKPAPQGQTPSV